MDFDNLVKKPLLVWYSVIIAKLLSYFNFLFCVISDFYKSLIKFLEDKYLGFTEFSD